MAFVSDTVCFREQGIFVYLKSIGADFFDWKDDPEIIVSEQTKISVKNIMWKENNGYSEISSLKIIKKEDPTAKIR